MPYFSRLTDIVTCNLSSILKHAEDPEKALEEIIREMEQGVAGAQRSAKSAFANVANIESQIGEQRRQVDHWLREAQQALTEKEEQAARQCLQRKHEIEDLISGLEQELQAAISTREHLSTMRNALEARLADARRRQAGQHVSTEMLETSPVEAGTEIQASDRQCRIDAELEALKNQLKNNQ